MTMAKKNIEISTRIIIVLIDNNFTNAVVEAIETFSMSRSKLFIDPKIT